MDRIKEVYANYNKCFFCGSNNLGSTKDYKFSNNPYTKLLTKKYSLNVSEMNSNLKLKECLNCHSYTFVQWFSEEIKNNLYGSQKHRMGWYKFFNTIFFYNEDVVKDDVITYKKLENEIGKIKNYLEIFCPFVGFFPLFSFCKDNSDNNKNLFNSKLTNFLIFLQKFYKRNVNIFSFKTLEKIEMPNNIFFLEIEDLYGWDKNCNSFNCNCKTIASRMNWVKNVNLNNFSDINEEIDLLNLSNTLDHIQQPLSVLTKIHPKIKNIFIDFHDIHGGPQHPYFLTEKTTEFISYKFGYIKKKIGKNQILLKKNG